VAIGTPSMVRSGRPVLLAVIGILLGAVACRRPPAERNEPPSEGVAVVSTRDSAPGAPLRRPVVASDDATWATIDRRCGQDEPVWAPSPTEAIDSLAPPHSDSGMRSPQTRRRAGQRPRPGGFAGMYFEAPRVVDSATGRSRERQRRVVLFVDTAAARRRSTGVWLCDGPNGDRPGCTRYLPARWTWDELVAWSGYLQDIVWAVEGVNMSDIDERDNRLVYGVRDAAARRRLEARLAQLELPCYLVGIATVQFQEM
jgi:hypothetical protein